MLKSTEITQSKSLIIIYKSYLTNPKTRHTYDAENIYKRRRSPGGE